MKEKMKYIIGLFFLTICAGEIQSQDVLVHIKNQLYPKRVFSCKNNTELPLYTQEFVSALGIKLKSIRGDATAHIDIQKAIEENGFEKTLEIARNAVDPHTKHKYFLITKFDNGYRIEKGYPTEEIYIGLILYLWLDENNNFSGATFAKSFGPLLPDGPDGNRQ